MSERLDSLQIRHLLLPMFIGAGLRLFRLDAAPFWLDETFTLQWVRLPWAEMITHILADNSLPLYYVLLKPWATLFGYAEASLRLPGAFYSWLSILAVARVAMLVAGRRAAIIAGWLTALSPFLIHHGQEARPYALLVLLTAACFHQLLAFVLDHRRRLGAAFVLTNIALLLTHYYAIFVVAAEIVTLVALEIAQRVAASQGLRGSTRQRELSMWLPAAASVSAAVAMPVLAALLLAKNQAGSTYEFGALALPGAVWGLLTGYTLLPTSAQLHADGWRAGLGFLPVAALGGLVVGWAVLRGLRALRLETAVVVAWSVFVPITAPLVVSGLLNVSLNPRYEFGALPGLLVLLAAGLVGSWSSPTSRAGLLLIVAILVFGAGRHIAEPGHGRVDLVAVENWLDANTPVDEEVLVISAEMLRLARYTWPGRQFRLYPSYSTETSGGVNAATLPEVLREFPFGDADRRLYVVGRAFEVDPQGLVAPAIGEHFASCGHFGARGVDVYCVQRRPWRMSAARPR